MPRFNALHGVAVPISLCLGAMMLAAGLLKGIDPFAASYTEQLSASGLPNSLRTVGIAAEILAGLLFIAAWLFRGRLGRGAVLLSMAASLLVAASMLVASYVHVHPNVRSAVLPLQIKPPLIPLFVLALALVNLNTLRRLLDPRALVSRYGRWALVTGASQGIGAEFARQLAASGFSVVLVARTKARLQELADLIERQYRVETRVIDADLASQEGIERVKAATADDEIGLLVNCAGVATPGAYTWRREDSIRDEFSLNAVATSLLTHHFGQRMVRRGRGALVLVGSTFGHQPVPYFQHYAATKAFVAALGHALRLELKPAGVEVLVLSPGPTRTAMREMPGIDFRRMPLLWMSASSVVAAALDGLRSGKAEVVPGVANRLMSWIGRRAASAELLAAAFGFLTHRAVSPTRLVLSAEREENLGSQSRGSEAERAEVR